MKRFRIYLLNVTFAVVSIFLRSAQVCDASIICQPGPKGKLDCKDPRGPLSEVGAKAGMTPDEIDIARQSTLKVDCGEGVSAAGALYGTCHQLVTNIHVLERNGKIPKQCHISNFGQPSIDVDISINEINLLVLSDDWKTHRSLDFAAIKLPPNIPGTRCFPLDPSGDYPASGKPMIIVSPYQRWMTRRVEGPVAVSCHVRDLYPGAELQNMKIYSDCSTTDQTSGSMVLIRDEGGTLRFKALHGAGTGRDGDGKAYDKKDNSEEAFGIDMDVVRKLDNFQNRPQ